LTDAEEKQAPPAFGELSPDRRYTVYSEDGDIFLYDRDTAQKRQLTATNDTERDPRFSTDGKTIYFTRDDNVFALSLVDATLRQLTDIRSGSPPVPPTENPGTSQSALKATEQELFETVRERTKQRMEAEAKRKKEETRKPFYLPTGQSVESLHVSPDGSMVAVDIYESNHGERNTIVPRYITETGYVEDRPGRSNVGDPQSHSRFALLKVATGEVTWIEFTPPEIKAIGIKPGPRRLSWMNWQWSDNGKHAVVMAHADDNKDVWIFGIDAATAKSTLLVQKHDDAWVSGPDWWQSGFLPDNQHVYYLSEQDGYAHLYTVSVDGGPSTQLTKGNFEVYDVQLSPDKTRFYFGASLPTPTERYLYSLPVDGGTPTRITRISGGWDDSFVVSPDDRNLALIRSEANRPPELFITPNRPNPDVGPNAGKDAIQITHSPTAEWLSYPWSVPTIVSYPARDGKMVPARLYKPAKWKPGGPAIVFVHGAGYLQNVDNWWSHYFREYMFHHLLKERGYLVLDVDYRGSAGLGRDWRTGIYRHMGGKDLDDVVDGAKWIVKTYGVDPKRIGIYGGSYGGFLTLMALFTAPDVFASGAALRPVTDWAHYNHGYTAEILNEPQNDPEAYRRSSPLFFAEGLKGSLLICHGMVDDNVHFQDSVRLVQRLIELRKENWELAAFPVESHSFTEPSSWADEYRRILKLFDSTLRRP
jgi:dipeptidyl aminopeptidase/acylaminoacyl peptidase